MSGTRSRKDFHLFAMLPQNNKTSTRREFFYFRESRREFYFRYSPRKVSSYEKYRDQTYCTVSAILFDNYQYYKERLLRNLLSFPFSISLAIGDDSSSYNGYGIHFWTSLGLASLGLGITWAWHHLGWASLGLRMKRRMELVTSPPYIVVCICHDTIVAVTGIRNWLLTQTAMDAQFPRTSRTGNAAFCKWGWLCGHCRGCIIATKYLLRTEDFGGPCETTVLLWMTDTGTTLVRVNHLQKQIVLAYSLSTVMAL